MFALKKILGCSLLLTGLQAASQSSLQYTLDSLAGAFIQNIRNTDGIQSYIQTDKSIYRAGETIWIRAFLLQSLSQRISSGSSLVVELVDSNDTAIKQILLDVVNQKFTANVHLPATIPTGYYWLRSYTIQMTLADSVRGFLLPIYVINPSAPNFSIGNNTNTTIQEPLHIRFFPEGGAMITGINSVVAFHIIDNAGNPVRSSGTLTDNRDSIVAHFTSNDLGIGKFEFFPFRARRYTATIRYKGNNYSFPLPAFDFFAGQIAIINSEKGIKRARILLEDSLYTKEYVTYLIGTSRDSLCFASIGKGNYELNIPVNQFPHGIATLYLFNQDKQLLSERSFYVSEENVSINASTDKEVYSKRSKIDLSISITDPQNHPVAATFSISAAEESISSVEYPDGLYEAFFRQTETVLRQWAIESSKTTDSMFRLLMLTNKTTLKPYTSPAREQSVDDRIFLEGKVTGNGKSEPNRTLTFFTEGQAMIFDTITTDSAGRFRIPLNNMADNTRFNIQLNNVSGKPEDFEIVLDSLRLPRLRTQNKAWPTFKIQPSIISRLLEDGEPAITGTGKEWLKPVHVKSKRNSNLLYESKRISPSSFIIPSSAFEKGGNGSVRNAVMRTPGLAINKGYVVIRGLNSTTAVTANAEPIIAMNGIVLHLPGEDINGPSPVLNFLNSLNPSDIEFIEVLRGPEGATFGTRGGNGVIMIHTANTIKVEGDTKNNLKSFNAPGYHNPSLFKYPNYDNKELKNELVTDKRSTLYWNGNMFTDETGKAGISFFTNDVPGKYVVAIHGITAKGDIIYKTIKFTVK